MVSFGLFDDTFDDAVDKVIDGDLAYVKTLFRLNKCVLMTDRQDNTLLHIACKAGRLNIVRYMLEQNVYDLDKKNKYRETCFDIACKGHFFDIVKILATYKLELEVNKIPTYEREQVALNSEIKTLRIQINECNTSRKRLREENDELVLINKKLKSDIIEYQNMLKRR